MTQASTRGQIVDTALALAERRSWEALRLYDVAAELGIALDDIRNHFREKEEIVDAWFDRADQAMLEQGAKPEVVSLPARTRIHRLLMTWLGALAAHRRVTRQMIASKLEPGHLHYQLAGLRRVSRTVQWLREAAGRNTTLPRRAFEETALTGIYLATFIYWMTDASEGASRTAAFLERLLARAERFERAFMFSAPTP